MRGLITKQTRSSTDLFGVAVAALSGDVVLDMPVNPVNKWSELSKTFEDLSADLMARASEHKDPSSFQRMFAISNAAEHAQSLSLLFAWSKHNPKAVDSEALFSRIQNASEKLASFLFLERTNNGARANEQLAMFNDELNTSIESVLRPHLGQIAKEFWGGGLVQPSGARESPNDRFKRISKQLVSHMSRNGLVFVDDEIVEKGLVNILQQEYSNVEIMCDEVTPVSPATQDLINNLLIANMSTYNRVKAAVL